MKRYNRIIKIKMEGNVRQYIQQNLIILLNPENNNVPDNHEPNVTASILMDVEKKMNKSLAAMSKPSAFKFKYHESAALWDFMDLLVDACQDVWLRTVMMELIAELDKQMK